MSGLWIYGVFETIKLFPETVCIFLILSLFEEWELHFSLVLRF
uniref:Uncharacterized protein n=1 Tax=Arundo donax TaxID=35708 RepID=A0A0A8Y513_ARUDO